MVDMHVNDAGSRWPTHIEDAGPMPVVLLVDDDPHLISAMQRNFRPYRLRLEVAFHGMQGVLNAVELQPDVVVTDLQMPFASGEELLTCLSQHPATIGVPIIILTGKPGAKMTSRYRRLGVKRVFVKPIQFETMLDELASLIEITPR